VFTPEEVAAAEALEASAVEIDSWDEVPEFASEAEEAAWWDAHVPSAAWFAREGRAVPLEGDARLPVPADTSRLVRRPPATPINLRLEADTVRRLRALAEKKGTKYQTLLKQFVVERLYEEERREGLVPAAERRAG
jgi:hypothetical protein